MHSRVTTADGGAASSRVQVGGVVRRPSGASATRHSEPGWHGVYGVANREKGGNISTRQYGAHTTAMLSSASLTTERTDVMAGFGARTRWVQQLLARRGIHCATVALANKIARVAWVLRSQGVSYQPVRA